MKNKIVEYLKNRKKELKKLKKKLINKDRIIQDQAETINYLIEQQQQYKEKTIELERKLKEEKSKIKLLEKQKNEN